MTTTFYNYPYYTNNHNQKQLSKLEHSTMHSLIVDNIPAAPSSRLFPLVWGHSVQAQIGGRSTVAANPEHV